MDKASKGGTSGIPASDARPVLEGPDIARVAEIGGLSKNYIDISAYVKDRKYWEDNFGSTLPWMRNKAG